MAPKNNSALYTILAKRFTNDRYASHTDVETAVFLFGMFLIPVWPFYIWNTPLQSRILASALFPIGGLAVALLLGWLVAQGKLSIVNHAESHTPPNNPKDNPFASAQATTAVVSLSTYVTLALGLSLGIGLPLGAWLPVLIFSLVGGALSYYSVSLYYVYFYDQNYNVGRVPEVIKEQLEQNRVILTGWLFILGALVVTPMFSIGQILEILTLPKQQEVWALLWLTGAYAWIGIGLLMLVILRIMETHWLREIQLEASLQSQKRE